MDNHYLALELFVMFREKYKRLACGTVQQNWKGWDTKVMNLSKIVGKVSSNE